jgi:hypothetical protein
MKLAVLRFVVVALACACAVIVVSNLRAQRVVANQEKFAPLYSAVGMPRPAQTPAAGTPEKTIAQEGREKNVKLLGDLPVSQFIPVMNYFAASLGRRCNFCHVNTNGQWDYASDAKPEKNTAREMIRLVLDTNKNFFKGNTEVSCYVCHRGRNNPQSVLPLHRRVAVVQVAVASNRVARSRKVRPRRGPPQPLPTRFSASTSRRWVVRQPLIRSRAALRLEQSRRQTARAELTNWHRLETRRSRRS